MKSRHGFRVALAAALLIPGVSGVGCTSTEIAVKEQLGFAKREQLVSKVGATRDSQQEAKQQFESALAEFLAVTDAGRNADVKQMEARYATLRKSYERSESRADAVRGRIRETERVGEALFREWKSEIGQYSSEQMRASSQRQFDATRAQFDQLVGAMRAAAGKMDPVLAAFKDQVLFLKHNLNAAAVGSLSGVATQIQSDVSTLVREMEASIAEADAFIRQMQGAAPAGGAS